MLPWPKTSLQTRIKQSVCDSTVSVLPSPSSMLLILIVFEQIVIGAIIENTPAERDGRLRPGDELISVDKNVVAGKPHKYVIDLMHAAARNGQVSLTVRRRVLTPGEDIYYLFFFCFCLYFVCTPFCGRRLYIYVEVWTLKKHKRIQIKHLWLIISLD